MTARENYKKITLKRKVYSKGGSNKRFKRFKKTPKYIKDNVENQVAREKAKDVYEFSASDDDGDDLGMGLEISDLLLDDSLANKQKEVIALTQDTVRPFFFNESEYNESKLTEALIELRHTSFRPNQLETIKRILFGRSTLFISPTGSGKSLCYQLPALLYWRYRKYMTIVVSPLISLMEDQMSNLPSSLRAVSLHSHHSRQQRSNAIQQLVRGEAQVVFVSPEAIVGGVLELEDLKNMPPVGFVCIDEAHCLSEWSHNFRPAYLQFFSILREQLKIKTFLGLTATASRATNFAISRCLTINPETDVIGATTVPENLMLSVSYESNKEMALIALLKSHTFKSLPSLIVYCNSQRETENIASLIRTSMQSYSSMVEVPERTKRTGSLNESHDNYQSPVKSQMKLSWDAEAYHAGMSVDARKRVQRQFIKGEIRVVVATIAFGMGINKANVRAVIHYDMPSSFESYVQEIGRAGRDGKTAQCHMFLRADMTDVYYQQRNIYSSIVEQKNLKKLVEYVFKPCRCAKVLNDELREKLNKMNQNDPYEIDSWQKTDFTDTPVQCTDDDLDGLDSVESTNGTTNSQKENKPIKYIRRSVIKKHRACGGHEVTFAINAATEEINLSPESIITFICQLQKAYPQLKILQFAPLRSSCRVLCYKGQKQMEQLRLKCSPISNVLTDLQAQAKRAGTKFEIPNEIKFDLADVAMRTGKSVSDIIRMLKKTEWELVEETGRFRRSQIRVTFDINSFHLSTACDLSDEEKDELHKFLVDYMKKYQTVERNKVFKMYETFKRHSISVDKMKDKLTRLQASMELKKSLDTHFNPTNDQRELCTKSLGDGVNDDLPQAKIQAITMSAREFISHHGTVHLPRAIARIFQGISCPNYPAEHWGKNRKWWRIHTDVDFLKLQALIRDEWIKRSGAPCVQSEPNSSSLVDVK